MKRLYVELAGRGLMTIEGEDRKTFLQGLVSNDVMRVSEERAVWAALLTAQGKYLHDFFLIEIGDVLFLEGEAERLDDLKRRLSLYKLRSKVVLDTTPDFHIVAAFGDGALKALRLADDPGLARAAELGVAYVDPRLSAMGARLIIPRDAGTGFLAAHGFSPGSVEDYERHRISLGVPDGSRDLAVEKSILLESGFDELNGIDWNKGCYMGQELTARTKYRGLVKKRLVPVRIEGKAPAPGTILNRGAEEAGEMRSSAGDVGLALLRLEAIEAGRPIDIGSARLYPQKPAWARF